MVVPHILCDHFVREVLVKFMVQLHGFAMNSFVKMSVCNMSVKMLGAEASMESGILCLLL